MYANFTTIKREIVVVSNLKYQRCYLFSCFVVNLYSNDYSFKRSVERMTMQGKGSYDSRAEMLHLIVELVEASTVTDNPEWRWG